MRVNAILRPGCNKEGSVQGDTQGLVGQLSRKQYHS